MQHRVKAGGAQKCNRGASWCNSGKYTCMKSSCKVYYFDHLRIVTVKEVGAYAEQVLQVGSVRSLVVDAFTVD